MRKILIMVMVLCLITPLFTQEKTEDEGIKPRAPKTWRLLPSQEELVREKIAQFDREMAKLIQIFKGELKQYVYKDMPDAVMLDMRNYQFVLPPTQPTLPPVVKEEGEKKKK